jgi:hypothetical protein
MNAVVAFLRQEGGRSSGGGRSGSHPARDDPCSETGATTAAVVRRFRDVPDEDALLFK